VKAKPAMLASGDMDFGIAQEHSISDFSGLFPNAPIVKLKGVGHFCQDWGGPITGAYTIRHPE